MADATDEARLQEFLFGAARIPLDPVRQPLRELQGTRCFYCAGRMGGAVEVDHFIPWSRHADNRLDNLVAADARCNGHKRDFLAAGDHVTRWVARSAPSSPLAADLADIASRAGWERHTHRTVNVARTIYLRLPAEVRLWQLGREFVPVAVERPRLAAALWRSDGSTP